MFEFVSKDTLLILKVSFLIVHSVVLFYGSLYQHVYSLVWCFVVVVVSQDINHECVIAKYF